jgi:hypothetical protein
MPNPGFREQVEDLALGTAWSLWAELGLSGWERRHVQTAIDVEPLILATPIVAAQDARLLGESLSWCVTNRRFVSAVRLKNLLKALPGVVSGFGPYSAAVNRDAHTRWPGATSPLLTAVSRNPAIPDLGRPALVQARLRALFGVSARAEVIRLLLPDPQRFRTIAELALTAGYGKDNVADSVEMLRRAGLVETASEANRQHVRLADAPRLAKLVGDLPASFPDWSARYRVTLALLQFARTGSHEPIPRAADIRALLRPIQPDIAREGIVIALRAGEAYPEEFENWAISVLTGWSADKAAATA